MIDMAKIVRRLKTEHALGYRGERWGIGVMTGHRQVGMKSGPFKTEKEALEEYGVMGDRIIHFQEDGQDMIRWWWHDGRWVRRRKIIL
jgi:hypothetical protein